MTSAGKVPCHEPMLIGTPPACRFIRASRILKTLAATALVFPCFFSAIHPAQAATISPEALEFSTRLDESVILSLDVDVEGDTSSVIDIKPDRFVCDRQVHPLGGGKYRIDIAPETIQAGTVMGMVQVTANGKALGAPIKVSGQIRPWIGVKPGKIFFGSIGRGEQFQAPKSTKITLTSDVADFDVSSVDFPEIAGAAWSVEPPQGTPARSKAITLTFTPDALAEGFPFGALARKFALVKTTLPQAALIPVPVTGMLSVNTTGRDYSTFLYKGQLRWEGHWPTPNIAAAFLSMALLLVCGIFAFLHRAIGKHANPISSLSGSQPGGEAGAKFRIPIRVATALQWSLGLGFLVIAAFGTHFLARTYSRGGWVAMAAGLLVLLLGNRRPRLYPIALAALFAIAIAFNPAGISRVASTGAVEGDKSIANRLLLWQGAFQMMAEHPWQGVGKGKFGEVFSRDYQQPAHTQSYTTAINDFLTLGTERGIFLLAMVTAAFLSLAAAGFLAGRQRDNSFQIGCAACIACGLVVSWFSSVAFVEDIGYLLTGAGIAILVSLIWQAVAMRWKQNNEQVATTSRAPFITVSFARLAACWGLLTIVLAAACLGAGQISLVSRPKIEIVEISGQRGLHVAPRWQKPEGTLVYIGARGESPADLLKSTLRPLAQRGWSVLCLERPEFLSDAQTRFATSLAALANPPWNVTKYKIAGHRDGATLALLLAAPREAPNVAAYLFPSVSGMLPSPAAIIASTPDSPRLLMAQDSDPLRSALHLHNLALVSGISQSALEGIVQPGDFNKESPKWQGWIDEADRFLKAANSAK